MTSTRPVQRGPLLTTLLTLLTIVQVLALGLALQTMADQADHGQDVEPVQFAGMLLVVLALVGLAGIWGRRRWGVRLLATITVIGLIADVAAGLPPLFVLLRLALYGAFFWAVANRWDDFR